VSGPLQQDPDRRLNGDVIVDNQNPCHSRPSASTILNQCLVVNPIPVARKPFFVCRGAMLLKKAT
jgi:hypothetical protein